MLIATRTYVNIGNFGIIHSWQKARSFRPSRLISTDSRARIIFSGIQSTGVPHLGNYLGALRQWVALQNDAVKRDGLLYCVVDLHAITVPQDAHELRKWRRETLAVLIAIGLDPDRCTIFYQSTVPEHTELMWILSCMAPMGYLSRMTQWKVGSSLQKHLRSTVISDCS